MSGRLPSPYTDHRQDRQRLRWLLENIASAFGVDLTDAGDPTAATATAGLESVTGTGTVDAGAYSVSMQVSGSGVSINGQAIADGTTVTWDAPAGRTLDAIDYVAGSDSILIADVR